MDPKSPHIPAAHPAPQDTPAEPAPSELARLIDHTLLRADATKKEIETLCREALRFGFAAVCVNGLHVRRCAEILWGSKVAVCSVVGFPLGAMASAVKVFEAQRAIEDGATEIDMVQDIGALKDGDDERVEGDIRAVAKRVHRSHAILKVILETCLLSNDEKLRCARIAKRAGADYVKTSTGFSSAGARVEDVALLRRAVGLDLGVKAAGGIRTKEDAIAMLAAGATRLGTSRSVAIAVSKSRNRNP